MKVITEYLLSRLNENPGGKEIHEVLTNSLQSSEDKHIGLLLSERLINMPTQIIGPAFNMLKEELEWALEEV